MPRLDYTPAQLSHASLLPIVMKSPFSRNFVPPLDIRLNGQAQTRQLPVMYALFGSGWYDMEQLDGNHWRWARSPAEITLYSPARQVVQISFTIVALAGADSSAGPPVEDKLTITGNGQNSTELLVYKNQPFAVETKLQPGWNVIIFALAAGNFIPAEKDPLSGDARELSFAVSDIEITGAFEPPSSTEPYP